MIRESVREPSKKIIGNYTHNNVEAAACYGDKSCPKSRHAKGLRKQCLLTVCQIVAVYYCERLERKQPGDGIPESFNELPFFELLLLNGTLARVMHKLNGVDSLFHGQEACIAWVVRIIEPGVDREEEGQSASCDHEELPW
jgi:hypothetical protein